MNEILKGFALILLAAGAIALGAFWPTRSIQIVVHLDQPIVVKLVP